MATKSMGRLSSLAIGSLLVGLLLYPQSSYLGGVQSARGDP